MNDESRGSSTRRVANGALDAHGRAALMLVESLVHTLIERSVISVEEALDSVGTAIDATQEITNESPSAELERSVSLLSAISQSLTHIRSDKLD